MSWNDDEIITTIEELDDAADWDAIRKDDEDIERYWDSVGGRPDDYENDLWWNGNDESSSSDSSGSASVDDILDYFNN